MAKKTTTRDEPGEGDDPAYSRKVGERLRAIRRQKKLSLQEVESMSDGEFKASVVGAYERGERTVSLPRLQRLAGLYAVPVGQLLPLDESNPGQDPDHVSSKPRKIVIDLVRLSELAGPSQKMLTRFLTMIQVQRGDFNGKVLTIRAHDVRAIAAMLDVPLEDVTRRLDDLGLLYYTSK
jgi:transcriptional regulator with XRE-family HTH domain